MKMCGIADLIRENSDFNETQAVQMLLVVTKSLEEENKALKKQLKSSKRRKIVKGIFKKVFRLQKHSEKVLEKS